MYAIIEHPTLFRLPNGVISSEYLVAELAPRRPRRPLLLYYYLYLAQPGLTPMRFTGTIQRIFTTARAFHTVLSHPSVRTVGSSSRFPLLANRTAKSMPTVPFLGALFGSSSSNQDMSYPVKKSDDEWRTVLSKGQSGGCI